MDRAAKRWLVFACKVSISILLIYVVLQRIDLQPLGARLAKLDLASNGAVLLLFLFQFLLLSARWNWIAAAIGAPLAVDAALRITAIGWFFNQVLPSSFGGDAVRIWLGRQSGMGLVKAAHSVVLDRVVGLMALIAIIGVTLPLFFTAVPSDAVRWPLVAVVATAVMATGLVLGFGEQLERLIESWRATRFIAPFSRDFRGLFRSAPRGMALMLASLVLHLVTVAQMYLIGRAMMIDVSLLQLLALIPPVMLMALIPVSFAGWGVREGVIVVALGQVGVPAADAPAMSIVYGLLLTAVGFLGGTAWFFARRNEAS